VVTNNVRDFRPLFARRLQQGLSHPGLILVPASRSHTRAATGALAADNRSDHADQSRRYRGPGVLDFTAGVIANRLATHIRMY
jgi:hypothetical protein